MLKLLSSTKYPLWVFLVWGIVVLGLNQGLTYWLADDPAEAVRLAEEERRITNHLERLRMRAGEFDTFAYSFAHGIMDKVSDIQERRDNLQKNILLQFTMTRGLPEKFDEKIKSAASGYRQSLSTLQDIVAGVDDLESLADFWDGTYSLIIARDVLLRELEHYRYENES